jgi:hypothetical protein
MVVVLHKTAGWPMDSEMAKHGERQAMPNEGTPVRSALQETVPERRAGPMAP